MPLLIILIEILTVIKTFFFIIRTYSRYNFMIIYLCGLGGLRHQRVLFLALIS